MSAKTTTGAGDWTDAIWTPAGTPGNGDTVSIGHAVAVSGSTTVGSSPATGGTAAIAFTAGGSLALTGGTLTVKGDIAHNGANTTVAMSAGTSVVFVPAAAAQYFWNFGASFLPGCNLTCNGTLGSPCSVSTDLSASGSTAMCCKTAAGYNEGILTASYTTFTNIGTTIQWGVVAGVDNNDATDHAVSITNCTFANSNCNLLLGSYSVWNGVVTFTGNTFTTPPLYFVNSVGFLVSFRPGGATSTGSIAGNVFDGLVQFDPLNDISLGPNNVLMEGFLSTSLAGPMNTFDSNFIRFDSSSVGEFAVPGNNTNNFWYCDDPGRSDPAFAQLPVGFAGSAALWDGNIYYSNQTGGDAGECQYCSQPANPCVWTVTRNIIMQAPSGQTAGGLVLANGDMSNITINVEHNTACVEGGFALDVGHLQTTVESPNRWGSYHGNLFWAVSGDPTVAAAGAIVVFDENGVGLADLVPPSVIGYNAQYKIFKDDGSGQTNAGHGYAIKFSSPFAPTGEIILPVAGAGPAFAKSPANATYLKWGQSLDNTLTTEAQVTAKIVARTSGFTPAALVTWLKAANRPTNAAITAVYDATHAFPGDTTTTDAAGNPMLGTAGAMAYLQVLSSHAAALLGAI